MKKSVVVLMMLCANFAGAQQWQTELEVAFKQAAERDKNVLLFFSVDEACESCRSLEENVLSTPEFRDFANDNFVMTKIDFDGDVTMEEKAENLLIVEKYNKDGFFPWVVILNKSGKILGKAGVYNNETPQQYIKLLQTLERT